MREEQKKNITITSLSHACLSASYFMAHRAHTQTHNRFYCTHFFSLPIWRKFCIEIIIDAWHFNWIQFIFYRSHTHTTCCYIGFWRQWKFNKTCFAFMALIHCFSTNSNRVHSFFPATIHFSAILVADSFRLIKGIKWINGQMGIHLTR